MITPPGAVARRYRPPAGPVSDDVRLRASLRFVWDVTVGILGTLVFACFVLAPRNVSPTARIPRPQARRMVARLDSRTATSMVRRSRGII